MAASVGRRQFLAAVAGTFAAPFAAAAQPATRRRAVAFLAARGESDPESRIERQAFEEGLAKLGWTPGRNVDIDYRWNDGDDGRIRAQAAELVAKVPDVIVTYGTQSAVILKRLTGTIPIIFINVPDPVASGLAASFARPGGNVTGFTSVEFSLSGKWLGILKELAPQMTRVMFLYNRDNSNWSGYLGVMESAAATLAVQVAAVLVATAAQIPPALEAFAREPNGGLVVVPSGLMTVNRDTIAALAVRHRLPAIYPYRYYAVSGGLASYGSDSVDLHRRAASYVDRVLKGEKPGELPIQAPSKFEFVVNLKAAKAIDLAVPSSLQILADEVIE